MAGCGWAEQDGISKKYHDEEWGIPVYEDQKQFEYLTMEVMQCGLSWGLMLKKREIFRQCFDGFHVDRIAQYGEEEIERIMHTEGMIRSRRKIEAIIQNATCFQKIQDEFGSFSQYLWAFSRGNTILYEGHEKGNIPAQNNLSQTISKDLKKRGFRYLGAITIYSHLQACGIINDHSEDCPRYREINEKYPTTALKCDHTE